MGSSSSRKDDNKSSSDTNNATYHSCQALNVFSLVDSKPNKYETWVEDENGTKLLPKNISCIKKNQAKELDYIDRTKCNSFSSNSIWQKIKMGSKDSEKCEKSISRLQYSLVCDLVKSDNCTHINDTNHLYIAHRRKQRHSKHRMCKTFHNDIVNEPIVTSSSTSESSGNSRKTNETTRHKKSKENKKKCKSKEMVKNDSSLNCYTNGQKKDALGRRKKANFICNSYCQSR